MATAGDNTPLSVIWVPGEATGNNFAGRSTALPVNREALGVGIGYKTARGVIALSGSNPTFVFTGLAHCYSTSVTLSGIAAPGVATTTLTTAITGSGFNVYAWKPTSNANPTLIASTGTEGFFWTAFGD